MKRIKRLLDTEQLPKGVSKDDVDKYIKCDVWVRAASNKLGNYRSLSNSGKRKLRNYCLTKMKQDMPKELYRNFCEEYKAIQRSSSLAVLFGGQSKLNKSLYCIENHVKNLRKLCYGVTKYVEDLKILDEQFMSNFENYNFNDPIDFERYKVDLWMIEPRLIHKSKCRANFRANGYAATEVVLKYIQPSEVLDINGFQLCIYPEIAGKFPVAIMQYYNSPNIDNHIVISRNCATPEAAYKLGIEMLKHVAGNKATLVPEFKESSSSRPGTTKKPKANKKPKTDDTIPIGGAGEFMNSNEDLDATVPGFDGTSIF